MPNLTHLLRQARRREFADTALRRAGFGLAIGTALSIVTLLIQRGFDLQFPLRALWVAPLIGAVGGIIHAWMTRPPSLQTAVNLDRSRRLKNRIGSAHELSSLAGLHIDGGFSALLRADAEQLAGTLDIRPATPIRITGVWGTAIVLCLLLWIGAAYLPTMKWRTAVTTDQPTPEVLAQLTPQAQQVAQTIEQSTRQLPKDDPALDAKSREDLAALERLSQQLSQLPPTQQKMDSARDEAAARMIELANRLAEQSKRDLSATDELAQKFSGMDSTGAPKPPMSADEFQEALKRGDFGAAAKELEDLLNNRRELSPEEQKALADHLRDTADRLESKSKSDDQSATARQEQFDQSLRDQGFTQEQIDRLHDQMKDHPGAASPEDLKRALEQQNFDPETAEQLARDLKKLLDEKQSDEQVQRDLNDVSRSLDDAAEQIEHPTPPEDAQRENNATQPSTDEPITQPPASQPDQTPTPPRQPQTSQPQTPSNPERIVPQRKPAENQPQGGQSNEQQNQNRQQQSETQKDDRDDSASKSHQDSKQPQVASQPQQENSEPQRPDQQERNISSQDRSQQQQNAREQPSASQPSPSQQPRKQSPSSQQSQPSQSQPAASSDQTRPSESQERRDIQQSQDQKGEQQTSDQNEQSPPQGEQQSNQQPNQKQPNQRQQDQPQGKPQQQKGNKPQHGKPEQGHDSQPTPGQPPQPNPQPGAQQPPDSDGLSPRDPARDHRGRPERIPGESPEENPKPGEPREPGVVPKEPGDSPSPSDAIRRIADRQQAAKDRQQISEQMKQRARELAERMSPEERERWAREWQKQNPPPSPQNGQPPKAKPSPALNDRDHRLVQGGGPDAGHQNGSKDPSAAPIPVEKTQPQTLDLRGNDPGEQMLSDFLEADPNTPQTGGQPRRVSDDSAERVRHAQEVAERAVNDSAVPSRYHQFIKRVFGNLNKAVPTAPSPATQPGG